MLSVCGYAYFYSKKNKKHAASARILTIQKITFVDEKI
jgi:cbb3-type cytochrome oxidase subunit 3